MTLPKVYSPILIFLFWYGHFFSAQGEELVVEVSSLKPSELRDFESSPADIQKVLRYALDLTSQDLGYLYGSDQPSRGGMDCSGTISHLLQHEGFSAPRMAHTIYLWVEKAGNMRMVKDCHDLDDPQLRSLRPGDLLFWEGTYDVGERNPPISHVMIYLGKRMDGKQVMMGASSGRYYSGQARHGVSVFDFRMPRATSRSKFVGYGPAPGLEKVAPASPPALPPSMKAAAAPVQVSSPVPVVPDRSAEEGPAISSSPVATIEVAVVEPAEPTPPLDPAEVESTPVATSVPASSGASRSPRSKDHASVRKVLKKIFRR
ncbi:MAG: NlpC/P60 family protein [Verrucomicrobiota bacterium]